ncbi:S53 family peptidase [Frondihabitans australicus]|uniref:Pro-kumamolisin-like protein n=1 Tax=Frondihabitans australicus TaxID=386892 RepID=A0A495IL20_9MICO|nr:S53 family peptidase [Frondihabitans australicus]RKR76702.1 pro-kumamolisin-like protein [Frondihabitans australicus]
MHVRRSLRSRSTARRTAAVVALAALTAGGLSAIGASSAQASTLTAYANAVPSWATKANLSPKTSSSASSTARVQGEVFLSLQDQAGAEAFAAAVSDPTSSQYRQYLSPSDWIAKYAPTQATFNSELSMLQSKGLTVTGSPASRQYIVFTGTQAQVNAAFGTKLETYSVDGQDVVAPSTAPSIPSTYAAHISGISLSQSRLLTRPKTATQSGGATGTTGLQNLAATLSQPKGTPLLSTPCSAYAGQKMVKIPTAYGSTSAGTANCGYTPTQLRAITKTTKTSGTGQTVAIIDAYSAPSVLRDANTYSALKKENGFAAGQYVDLTPSRSTFTSQTACGGVGGWQVEQTLDVEAVHAVAPGANVVYQGATDCGAGMDLALSKVLDQGLANLVSNSYGGVGEPLLDDPIIQGEENLQLQAAGEGVGLYFASGDSGDESINLRGKISTDFPASSPWVTAVGGTAAAVVKNNTVAWETGWGDSLDQVIVGPSKNKKYRYALPGVFTGGAGGGTSNITSRPAYQASVTTSTRRQVPDVSALADPYTGFAIGYHPLTSSVTYATGSWKGAVAGGTSLATPILVAQMAAIQQATGARIGFANPILYSLHSSSPSTFTDVLGRAKPALAAYTASDRSYVVTFGADSSLKVGTGYDNQTGLGDLNLTNVSGFATPPSNN